VWQFSEQWMHPFERGNVLFATLTASSQELKIPKECLFAGDGR